MKKKVSAEMRRTSVTLISVGFASAISYAFILKGFWYAMGAAVIYLMCALAIGFVIFRLTESLISEIKKEAPDESDSKSNTSG